MIKKERNYWNAKIEARAKEDGESGYIVEGYAATFDDPYERRRDGDKVYYEAISRDAFNDADMTDVIMQYDHCGMVFARLRNGTLKLTVDEHGLHVWADLSSTEESRKLYEAIDKGLVCEMSWAFTIAAEEYDSKKRTRTITAVHKVYDVSAVSIPANPNTEISARNFFDGVIEEERRRDRERETREMRIRLKLKTF